MKYLFAFALVLMVMVPARGQGQAGGISESYPGFRISFHGPADTAGDIAVSSIVGATAGKSPERFGVMFRNAPATMPVIEIVSDKGAVLKGITVRDLAGKGLDRGVKLLSSGVVVAERYMRNVYEIAMPGAGTVRLIVKAIATGDPSNTGAQHPLVVTYALAGDEGRSLALRLALPVEGLVETSPSGFVVTARRGAAAFAAIASPAPQAVTAAANMVTITTHPAALAGDGTEVAMLWLQIDGSSGDSPATARSAALGMLKAASGSVPGPNIIVVSAVDKPNVNPADTVSMTLICVNIGTQGAAGVTLKNPVPQGTTYLANSAGGDRMNVSFDRNPTPDGSDGEINAVRWTMSGQLRPGEDRVASFKTIVR